MNSNGFVLYILYKVSELSIFDFVSQFSQYNFTLTLA